MKQRKRMPKIQGKGNTRNSSSYFSKHNYSSCSGYYAHEITGKEGESMEIIERIECGEDKKLYRSLYDENGNLLQKSAIGEENQKNSSAPEIVIKTDGIVGTEIFVNGKKLDGVRGFRFQQNALENKGLPILQLDLKATNVTLETKAIPKLPYPFSEFYVEKSMSD